MKYVYLRRKIDGAVIDVPENQVEETLKRGFDRIGEVVLQNSIELPVVSQGSSQVFHCILCGFEGKNAQSLRMHKTKAHA